MDNRSSNQNAYDPLDNAHALQCAASVGMQCDCNVPRAAHEIRSVNAELLKALKDLGDWLAYGLEKADGAEPTAEDHAACMQVAAQARAAVDRAERKPWTT